MWVPTVLLAVPVLASCSGSSPKDVHVGVENTATSTYVLGELHVWPSVDTTDAFNSEAIACLRRFCANKMYPDRTNDYWYPPDLERYGGVHAELLYAEFDSVGDARYPPTLLAVRSTSSPDQRLLTVRWAAMDSTGAASDVRYVYDLLARRTDVGIRLSFPIDELTRAWERRQVGPINYVLSPGHIFSEEQAAQQLAAVERLSRFFDLPAFPITFYSCTDPTDLFRMRGYQQHPLMHLFPTGGRAEGKDIVYSGNDKDVYTHEIVHLFSGRKYSERSWLLDEGLATLLAGSNEYPFTWHRANLKHFLEKDPTADLIAICSTYDPRYINEHTNVAYAVGGVLCERILRTKGKEALFTALAAGEDPWPTLAGHGITKTTLNGELLKDLALPPFAIP